MSSAPYPRCEQAVLAKRRIRITAVMRIISFITQICGQREATSKIDHRQQSHLIGQATNYVFAKRKCYSITLPMKADHNHQRCRQELLSRAEAVCKLQGSRLTEQRRDILACVAEDHSAIGAYDIINRMARRGVVHAPVTIYRALEFLEAHGLVHKIESRNAFVACSCSHAGRPAALLICDSCNSVEEVDAPDLFRSVIKRAEQAGFQPRQTVVEVEGQCRACGTMD